MTILKVNGEEIEGITDVVAYTKKRNEIGDLTTRILDYTNAFKAPFTPNNHRVLRNSNNPNSETNFPYTLHDVVMIEDGIEIVTGGRITVRRVAGFYELYVLSGPAGFFKAIEGKLIDQIDPTNFTGPWSPDTQMNNTNYWAFPVLNWGLFNGSAMDNNANLPSLYYKDVIDQIFRDAGYTKAGSVFSSSKFTKMIIPFGRKSFSYADSFTGPYEFSAVKTADQALNSPAFATIITFQQQVKQSAFYNTGTSKYINSGTVTFYAHFFAQFNYTRTGGAVGVTVELRKNGATVLATAVMGGGSGTITFDSRTLWPDGFPIQNSEEVYVMIASVGSTWVGTVFASEAKFYNQILTTPIASGALGDTVFSKFLPEMTQTDFIKDFMVRFGVIPIEKAGVITFKTLNEILSDAANARDWTNKRIAEIDDMSFNPLDYAQNNYFRDSSNNFVNTELGKGDLQITNELAEVEKDIYESVFTNTETSLVNTVLTAKIPVFSTSSASRPFENEPGNHLLLVRDKYSFEPTINGNAAYKVAYYEDPNQPNSMNWEQSLSLYYSILEASLQKAKVIKRRYNLTVTDFLDIDFAFIIFDKDSYYMLNTVSNFVTGKPTQVELFKLK